MRFITIIVFSLLLNLSVYAELLSPNINLNPKEVIKIQLKALMNNNLPYKDAGITQTWEFAHPQNRAFTGPLSNFTLMMKSDSYSIMIDHTSHNIILVSKEYDVSNYFVELTDKIGNKFGFTWTLQKVLIDSEFKDCWMTTGVSDSIYLGETI